jgi:hypothetical protein
MNSMVIETDMVRTMWVLLMDGQQQGWSKLVLYLHKGNWNGEQVLDELGKILSKTYQYI